MPGPAPRVKTATRLKLSSRFRSHRLATLGYPFNGLTSPLVSARVHQKTIAPPGHLRAGRVVGEYSEGLTLRCRSLTAADVISIRKPLLYPSELRGLAPEVSMRYGDSKERAAVR